MKPSVLARLAVCGVLVFFWKSPTQASEPARALFGHWKLLRDGQDSSGNENHATVHGVAFDAGTCAVFDGVDDSLHVPNSKTLNAGTSDFSIAVWIHTDDALDDVLGDVLSKFDPATRTGINLTLINAVGGASAQANYRNISFGIDAASSNKWVDRGRPGNSKMVWALTVFDGELYAGTWEPGENEAGHVYRYAGGDQWVDCGSPDACNAVWTMGEHDGRLYAGTALYTGQGSALPASPNKHPGGKVFRYEGDDRWTDCGKIADVYTVTGLVSFKGDLYATTCDSYGSPTRTAACYRYEGDKKWTLVGGPGARLGAFAVYNGSLFATTFGGPDFARYDGESTWEPLGPVPDVNQNYSTVIHQGHICMGTWPLATVFRYDGPGKYTSLGRLGEELEVMAMAVYNGKLYAGTLPLGQVYRYESGARWTLTGRLDMTPDVRYRRVWSMAVFDGKLFAGTLPSGRVHSLNAGICTTYDRKLKPGWRHLAAVKSGGILKLYIDGKPVAQSAEFDPGQYDLSNQVPLRIGVGEHDHFNGKMRDLRLYRAALDAAEVVRLAQNAIE